MEEAKKISTFLALLLSFFLLASIGEAKEIKTITLFGGFIDNAKKFDRSFYFPVPPDGITEVYYAKAKVRADMTGTSTRIYFYVDGKSCIPSYYDVGEKSWGYTMEFDCTSIVNKTGDHIFTVDSNKNLQNIYVEWEITYLNNPKFPKLGFFGTEYYPNAKGKIFLQYLDMYGNPINDALCVLDIFNPDNAEYMKGIVMDYIPSSNGLYAYDLIVPSEEGVYPLSAFCVSPSSYTKYLANNFTITQGTQTGGDFTYTHELDGLTHDVQAPSNYSYIFQYSFENVSRVSVDIYLRSVNNTIAQLLFFNCSLGGYSVVRYMPLANMVWTHYSRELKGEEIICNNRVELLVRNPYTSNLQIDTLFIRLWNITEEQTIRRGGEMHVSNIAKFFDLQEETLIYNHDYCIDNTTLRKEKLVQKCVDATCWNVTKYEDIVCNYGCLANECKRPDWENWLWIGIIIVSIVIAIFILMKLGGYT
ncbi:MAG: hypothetical protein QXL51_01395 [Candidatus Aenigmatarchaeota archaeon]